MIARERAAGIVLVAASGVAYSTAGFYTRLIPADAAVEYRGRRRGGERRGALAGDRPAVGYGSFDAVMAAVEGALAADGYLAGDSFTAADLYLGSQLGFGMMFGTIEKRPVFERYWARLGTRPAAVRAKEIDDAAMAASAG